jgi:2-haloacid dehalogenase
MSYKHKKSEQKSLQKYFSMNYTLAFDVYGTLINTSGVFENLQVLIGEKASPFMDSWRNKQLEYSFRRGLMKQYVDFSVCTKNALDFCCQLYQLQLTENQKENLLNVYKVLPAFADVKEGLQLLRETGHHLLAFSNGSNKAIEQLLENAQIRPLFDGIVSVENIQTFKPDPQVYEYFNEKTHSTKSDSWLISSNPFDVIGAVSYGMRSAWLQRSEDSIFDPWGIEPTITISSITELNEKLASS